MKLCIDVGNSHIHIALLDKGDLIVQFRYATKSEMSSDEFGIFIINILSFNNINYHDIKYINICSVVPDINYSIKSACSKYFNIDPFFLTAQSQDSLIIKYASPQQIGADRIATSIGAINIMPKQNLIIIDMGTATTIDAVTKNSEYLGGAIISGIKTSLRSLNSNTAKLPLVNIEKPKNMLGSSTKDNIQIGSYYGHFGAIKETVSYIAKHAFDIEDYRLIGTGGFIKLYNDERFFDLIQSELIFFGLNKFQQT